MSLGVIQLHTSQFFMFSKTIAAAMRTSEVVKHYHYLIQKLKTYPVMDLLEKYPALIKVSLGDGDLLMVGYKKFKGRAASSRMKFKMNE
jgi:hypothetical protein